MKNNLFTLYVILLIITSGCGKKEESKTTAVIDEQTTEITAEELAAAEKAAAVQKAVVVARATKLALEKASAELAAAEARANKLTEELAAAEKAAAVQKAAVVARATELALEKASAELAAAELAVDKSRANKLAAELAAAEKAVAKAQAKELAAELAEDCQKVYNMSQELYRARKFIETMEILETTLRMEGCDEELNSKAFYLIGWNYANDQGKPEKARAMYQKVVDSFSPGLKYVDKAERRLAGYSLNDLAEAAYENGRFGAVIALRKKVVKEKGFDKELKAKNQYLIGYIYQYKLEELDKAKEAYQKVGDIHPKSEYVDKAKQKLETL